MLNFEWYRSFIAVYRSGTVTGAAQARFLTQPAISQHLVALETAVGHALFQRTPRRMIPTEHGKALYSRVAPAMDGLERVSVNLRDSSATELPVIRLGTPLDYFHEAGLEKLNNAGFRLQVELGEAGKLLEALSRGKLDAVIATQHLPMANVGFVKIAEENFCLVSSAISLPPLKKTRDKLKEIERFLKAQPWLSYSAELPIIRRFWQVAFKRRPDIEPVMIVPSLLLIRKAVELGWGISVLPHYLAQESLNEGRLKILWQPKSPLVNDLWVATRKVDRNRNEIMQFISLMQGK